MLRATGRTPHPGVVRVGAILLAVACVVGTLVGAAVRDLPLAEAAPMLVVGLLFVVAGVVASSRRPGNVSGRLLSLTGLSWLLSLALTTVDQPVIYTIGLALFAFGLAPLGHLAITFPGGTPSSRLERVLVAVPYALCLAAVPVVNAASCEECPPNPVGLDIRSGIGRLWYSIVLVAVLLTSAAVLAVLVRRWRAASPVARRVLLPVLPGACVFAALYIGAILAELGVPTGLGERWALVGLVLLAGAPVVFLGGLLRARLARAHVGELVVELGDSASRHSLRDALADALRDPSIEVAYWIPERTGYVDSGGSSVELPTGDPERAVSVVERDGRRVGALVYDPALRDDPALVDAVAAAAGLAMENERLHAEVLARLEEVQASRARIVEAADDARRRVERDLHDGAQQRLVQLNLAVGMARARLDNDVDPALDGLLHEASDHAVLALRELRDLAHGLHPTILAEAGLVAGIESLAERSTVPVELAADVAGPLPAAVEVTAYYVVSEALANVTKHADASSVQVQVATKGDRLMVEVSDDGAGGAHVRPGSGLQGLADRVAALNGQLGVESHPGRGTRVVVSLPCG